MASMVSSANAHPRRHSGDSLSHGGLARTLEPALFFAETPVAAERPRGAVETGVGVGMPTGCEGQAYHEPVETYAGTPVRTVTVAVNVLETPPAPTG